MKVKNSKEMYADSPKLSRNSDGKMGVQKPGPTEAERTANAVNAESGGMPVHEEMMARHSNDRHMMHAKHEHEHAMHKSGDKKEMHERHAKDHKDMFKKHDKEIAGGLGDAMDKGEQMNEGA